VEEINRSYYAIIPANVRYDKSICHGAKLLYGEITALCNEKGFCWASNKYFAELYGISSKTISVWVNSLINNNYLKVNYRYIERTKAIQDRCLCINENFHTYGKKCGEGMEENVNTPMEENVKDNNTKTFNNTVNILKEKKYKKEIFKKPTLQELTDYCITRNNHISPQRFIDYYDSKGWIVGKAPMKDWMAAVRLWEGTEKRKENDNGGVGTVKSKCSSSDYDIER